MTADELAKLVVAEGEAAEALHAEADRLRCDTVGDAVHLRALIEFSNHCRCHCAYCGLRAGNLQLPRYRLTPDELVGAALLAADLGFGTVVLQSGEDPWWTAERLAEVIARIKGSTDLAVTLSVGEREKWEYRLWREAGADRFLLKHETADPELYARLHPGASQENRLRCLEALRELGYQIGTGFIIGLPGQTPQTLAQDLLLLQRLRPHMAGIGPLIPHPNTPLGVLSVGSAQASLNAMALARLLVPDLMLASTTAQETASPGGRRAGLRSGANVVMPNLTPRRYASYYEIYPGKKAPRISLGEEVSRAKRLILSLGRTVGVGPGHSPRAAA